MGSTFTIAHLSDIHCGDPHFVPDLMDRAIAEINGLEPDIVVCSGDLTTFGFKEEYAQAKRYLDRIECDSFVVVPGNHDSRNVGYLHFEDLYGPRSSVLSKGACTVVAVDSTEPDLDHGSVGRGRYGWIEEQFDENPSRLRVFVLHHHLLPVPGTGRERNVVHDAGDALECLQRAGVQLVLSGHMHDGQITVPYVAGKLRLAHLKARYWRGTYGRDGTTMHVSAGLGTTFVPFRFFARPEATELVLKPA